MLPSSAVTAELRVESEPPGADATTSTGANCRTPCLLSVAASQEFSITVSANGYQPQTIAVTPLPPMEQREAAGSAGTRLDPNPVIVQLEPVPPPAKKPPAKKKSKQRAARIGAAG